MKIRESNCSKNADSILVLDFGGQYAHLIGRRIREQNVYSRVLPYDIGFGDIRYLTQSEPVKGMVLSGGPSSVYEKNAPKINSKVLDLKIPKLRICYGHQLIAHLVGGDIERGETGEYGITKTKILKKSGIFRGLGPKLKGWTSHRDIVRELPSEFKKTAKTENCPMAAFESKERNIYGIQWHPEVTHTEQGNEIFTHFHNKHFSEFLNSFLSL